MRSGIHGTFATLLLMVPVLSIPALAIFGIPQFAPVVASPLDENPKQDRERRVGKSARPSGDSFMDELDATEFDSEPLDRRPNGAPGRLGHRDLQTPTDRTNPDSRSNPRTRKDTFDSRSPWSDEPEEVERSRDDDFRNNAAPKRPQDRSDDDAPRSRFQDPPRNPDVVIPDLERGRRQRGPGSGSEKVQPESGLDYRRGPETDTLTWKEAVRRLNELEIRNFRLQPGLHDSQFAFSCMYTPSDNPRISTRFEAEADEPLKAVEKVLAQIEVWQQRH